MKHTHYAPKHCSSVEEELKKVTTLIDNLEWQGKIVSPSLKLRKTTLQEKLKKGQLYDPLF